MTNRKVNYKKYFFKYLKKYIKVTVYVFLKDWTVVEILNIVKN